MNIQDFTERRQFRGREIVSGIGSRQWFERESAPLPYREDETLEHDPQYQRHTVDIPSLAPVHVEDEALAFERGWRRAKVAWVVLLVLVAGYVAWRLWQ